MDSVIEFAKLLTEHPLLAALVEIGTLVMVIWLWRDTLSSRERWQERMSSHETECAERWGYVRAKLDRINGDAK